MSAPSSPSQDHAILTMGQPEDDGENISSADLLAPDDIEMGEEEVIPGGEGVRLEDLPHDEDDIELDSPKDNFQQPQSPKNLFTKMGGALAHTFEQGKKGVMYSQRFLEEGIKDNFKNTNALVTEGLDAAIHLPGNLVGKVSEKVRAAADEAAEQREKKESIHWKHVSKLIKKYESLDYPRIYNQSYRKELERKFFHVTGDYEWLRWILYFFMGVFIGFIAYLAHFGIQNIQEYKFEVIIEWAFDVHMVLAFMLFWLINFILATLSSWLAVYYEPTAAGSGIPEVKAYLNGTKIPGFFRLRTLWTKLISMICANGASLQVGAEGPMIHIGALVGNGISQAQSKEFGFKVNFMKHFRNDRDKRDFITSGAGAGVAAAFGAPLGGTLFSLEEVASFWSTLLTWRTFFLSMVAVFAMKMFLSIESGTKFDSGFMIFNVGTSDIQYRFLELIPFLVIGVIGGLLGALWTAINLNVTKFRGTYINKKKEYRVFEVMTIVTVSSCLQFLLPFLFPCTNIETTNEYRREALTRHYCGEGKYNDLASMIFVSNEHAIYNLLSVNDASRVSFLATALFFVFYFFGSVYTAGAGISSGTFVPMIVVGSAYGRMVGLVVRAVYGSSIDPGIYAIMGAASFMAGISRLTLSLTVILIEITNDLANLIPIMLVVMTAKWVADPIIHPFFDKLIEMKNIPYLEPNATKEMKLLKCKHIMAKKPKFFMENEKIGNILSTLKSTTHNGFPIVNNNVERRVKGLILRSQLLILLDRISSIYISQSDMVYSQQDYQTKLSWTLPKLSKLEDDFCEEEDRQRMVDLTPYMNITVLTVNEEFAVSEAYLVFRTMGLRHLPVVNEHNKLKGVLTKKDLLEHNCEEIYRQWKDIKKRDFTAELPGEPDETPFTSPTVPRWSSPFASRRASPAPSRRPSPGHSRAVSRKNSSNSLITPVKLLKEQNPH